MKCKAKGCDGRAEVYHTDTLSSGTVIRYRKCKRCGLTRKTTES